MWIVAWIFLAVAIAIPVQIYINFPPPPLTARVTEWKKNGKFATFNGKSIFYVDVTGTGSFGNLICFHGYPTSSHDWTKILPGLKKKFNRIVMFDFVGFGFSDKPGNITYSILEQADIGEQLLQMLQIRESHVLSHDYGDSVALEILARNNEGKLTFNMMSLSMMNGGIFRAVHKPRRSQKALLLPVIGQVVSGLINLPFFEVGFSEIFGANKPTKEDFDDIWCLFRYNYGDLRQYLVINFLRDRETYAHRWVNALKETKLKVLMIYGPADPVNPSPDFPDYWKKTVPQHKLVELSSDIGHYPQWEDPDSCNKALFSFIEDVDTNANQNEGERKQKV